MGCIGFQGTKLSIGVDVAGLVLVGNLTGYSRTGGGRAEIDCTNAESTSKEYKMGLRDGGSVSVDVNYDPEDGGWSAAEAGEASDLPQAVKIEFNNPATPVTGTGTIKNFLAYVVSTSDTGSVDSKLTGTIELKITGDITTTPAT